MALCFHMSDHRLQRTNQARRGSLKRPDPPRTLSRRPRTCRDAGRSGRPKRFYKKCSGLPPFRVSSLERPHPSSVRLQRGCAWRRLTEETAGPRQAGDEARTDGIGDAREHGGAAAELAFPANKILISAAIEGRGAHTMVGLV